MFPQIMMTVPRDQRPNEEPYSNVSEKFVGLVKALTPANWTSQPYRRARTTSLYHQGPYHQPLPPGPVPPAFTARGPYHHHQGYCTKDTAPKGTAPGILHRRVPHQGYCTKDLPSPRLWTWRPAL